MFGRLRSALACKLDARELLQHDGPAALNGIKLFAFAEAKLLKLLMERVSGIEPPSSAWKAVALPLSYTRVREGV